MSKPTFRPYGVRHDPDDEPEVCEDCDVELRETIYYFRRERHSGHGWGNAPLCYDCCVKARDKLDAERAKETK